MEYSDSVIGSYVRLKKIENKMIEQKAPYFSTKEPYFGWLLIYLLENKDKEIFQRDIERDFYISKASVSKVISFFEKEKIIASCKVSKDARLKKVYLTDLGLDVASRSLKYLAMVETEVDIDNTTDEDWL